MIPGMTAVGLMITGTMTAGMMIAGMMIAVMMGTGMTTIDMMTMNRGMDRAILDTCFREMTDQVTGAELRRKWTSRAMCTRAMPSRMGNVKNTANGQCVIKGSGPWHCFCRAPWHRNMTW